MELRLYLRNLWLKYKWVTLNACYHRWMIFSWGKITLDGPYYPSNTEWLSLIWKMDGKGSEEARIQGLQHPEGWKGGRELKETGLFSSLCLYIPPHEISNTPFLPLFTHNIMCQLWDIMIWYFYRLHTIESCYEILTIFPLLYIISLGLILKIVFWTF